MNWEGGVSCKYSVHDVINVFSKVFYYWLTLQVLKIGITYDIYFLI